MRGICRLTYSLLNQSFISFGLIYHIEVKKDKILESLKKLLFVVDEKYSKTKILNLLNYKHLLMTSAQVMELIEKEQNIFVLRYF